jgi:uncharacterized protein (TIGR03032 family)
VPGDAAPRRAIRYQHSRDLPGPLDQAGISLRVTTYQAGKLIVVSSDGQDLALSHHNFEQAMGLAARPDRIAVGCREQVWVLRNSPQLAAHLPPAGRHGHCFLARTAHVTGPVRCHEMAWAGDELWFVNTLFSCLATLHPDYNFVPRWRPPFVSALAAEDRRHLNGLAMADGRPKYVTALAETDTPHGWRPRKETTGVVIDVPSGATVARGFAMPYAPRLWRGHLFVLDSGTGRLVVVDPADAKVRPVAALPGYTRGLAFHGGLAFVGLSRIRETAVFGGLAIAAARAELKCGVAVIELATGRLAAHLEFQAGVEEIFGVQVLPGVRWPVVHGPYATQEDEQPIWLAPAERRG